MGMKWYDWSPERSQYDFNKEAWPLLASAFDPHSAGCFEYAFSMLEKGVSFANPFNVPVEERGGPIDFEFAPAPEAAHAPKCRACGLRPAYLYGYCLACSGSESA